MSFSGLSVKSKKIYGPDLPFQQLRDLVPTDWLIVERTENRCIFGKLSDRKFNGNPVLSRVVIDNLGNVSVYVADSKVDLKDFYIADKITFNAVCVGALFRCATKVVGLCQGHEVNKKQFSSGTSMGTKETMTSPGKDVPMYMLRHIYCDRVVSVNSSVLCCKKCASLFYKLDKKNSEKCSDEGISNPNPTDLRQVLRSVAPNLNENQIIIIESQLKASSTKSNGMRWPKEIISMALGIFNRSPSAYRVITNNDWIRLPSEQLLSLYKHAVKQKPGIIPEMMIWMRQEAQRQNIPTHGFYGGLIMDEMAIQQDLQITHSKDGSSLMGLSDSGKECFLMSAACTGDVTRKLADHVQQYLFVGLTGFRWPFANFPNTQAPPAELFSTTWKCVEALNEFGFNPIYCCMDGSSNNRAFLKMHFHSASPLGSKMVARQFKNPTKKLIFMMDPCHLLKKIRNSILSSGFKPLHTRVLTLGSHVIVWQMWIDAYMWDRSNPFPVHQKLSDDHIFPNNAQKMRNKLAFDVLDKEMLHLMKTYQQSLTNGSNDLEGAFTFLENSSFLVDFFADNRPIKDMSDNRLKKLSEVYNWFKSWEKSVSADGVVNKRYKSLITMETREDLDFMYHGFYSLVQFVVNELRESVVPSRINSDIIENVFCQQRSIYHCATINPSYNDYRTAINSIIIGQSTVSRKSNASGVKAEPFSLSAKLPRL